MRLSKNDTKLLEKCIEQKDGNLKWGDFVNYVCYQPEEEKKRGTLGKLQSKILSSLLDHPKLAQTTVAHGKQNSISPEAISELFLGRDPDREGIVNARVFEIVIKEDLALHLSSDELEDLLERFTLDSK